MRSRASLRHDLSEIQHQLRILAAQNQRAHERLALKLHREEVAKETGSPESGGELDARHEAGEKGGSRPRLL